MGLFSSKKKTYVSSVVYGLAGPEEDRPNYLKSVVLGNILTQKRYNPAKVLTESYQSGPGIRYRNYHRWARQNYKQVGIPRDRILGKPRFNQTQIESALAADFGITAAVDWVELEAADISMWGLQWMRENMPDISEEDVWTVDYIDATDEALIQFQDGSTPVRFNPLGFRNRGDWLYISYSRQLVVNRWSTAKLLIYQKGTGSPALDAMINTSSSTGEYLPFIPIRHENEFLSNTYMPEVYKEAKAAYKKSIGNKFDDLIESLKDNPDLGEIDFAYIVFGVPINIKDNSCRRYMFEYFKHLMGHQQTSVSDYTGWASDQPNVQAGVDAWLSWMHRQEDNPPGFPIVGVPPVRPTVTSAPGNSVIITDSGPAKTGLKLEMKWNGIQHSTHTGKGKTDAKRNEVWFTFVGSQTINASAYTNSEVENLKIDTVELYHQVSDNQYEKLTLIGFQHINHIYNGKSVEITAAQGLVDEDESGFVIPLHYDVLRTMSLVDSTQVTTQGAVLVLNCYQIVKKKWYQRGIFKVILFVVAIVITVVTGGLGAGSVGLLGANMAVGAALGFAGLTAVIVGAVANMVAAMLLSKLITAASVALLGDKLGQIIGSIASMVALSAGIAMQDGGSVTSALTQLMEPMNLLQMTNSVGGAVSNILQLEAMDIMKDTQNLLDDYRKQTLELQDRYASEIGYDTAYFNPMALTEVSTGPFVPEKPAMFLNRTLMSGSDLATLSNDLITNFVELALSNEFEE